MTLKKPILVVRLSAIGDLVLTASVLGQLSEEGHELHLLVKDAYRSVGTSLPGVREVYSWDRDRARIAKDIDQYAAVLDLQGTRKTKKWTGKLALEVHTYEKPYVRRFLLLLTKIRFFALDHVVERYARAASPLFKEGFDGLPRTIDLSNVQNDDLPKEYIACVVGGTHSGKKLDFHAWRKLIQELKSLQMPIILLGGPEEAGIGESLEQPLGSGVVNYCGKVSILAAMDAVSKCALCITGDTGLMHTAALFQRPVISLWGGTHPYLGFTPWPEQPQQQQIITKSPWTPVSKHGKRPFWMPNPMKKLPLDTIKPLAAAILQGRTTP